MAIFDKDGNKLNVADVIYTFIDDVADKNNKHIDDVYIGADGGKFKCISTYEEIDGEYDDSYLQSFGKDLKAERNESLKDDSHTESSMMDNMQYYMEYCQREGYVSPKEWIEKHKHF